MALLTSLDMVVVPAVALAGAGVEFGVALNLYRPAGMPDANPLFDAVVFAVLYLVGFLLVGFALAFLQSVGPVAYAVLGLVALLGAYGAYVTYTGSLPPGVAPDRATQLMGTVASVVVVVDAVLLAAL